MSKDRRRVGFTARACDAIAGADIANRVDRDRTTITGCATTTGNANKTTRTGTVTAATADRLRKNASRFSALRCDMRTIGDINRATGATITASTGNPDKPASTGTRTTTATNRLRVNTRGACTTSRDIRTRLRIVHCDGSTGTRSATTGTHGH